MAARPEDIPGVVSSSGILPAAAPMGPEELQRRRAIAVALASKAGRPFPKTIGEGLTSLGEAFGDVMADKRLTEAERTAEVQRRARLASIAPEGTTAPGPTLGAGAAAPPPTAAPVAPPVAAAPIRSPRPMLTPAAPTAADPRDLIARAIAAREGMTGPTPQQPAREVASPDPTQAGEQPPPTSPTATASEPPSPTAGGDDATWAARQGAIASIESRGAADPYRAIGAQTRYGRGLGRYQVVEANVAPWTQAALGQALTPQQFLASPQAQDAVFRHRFGQYVDQFGEEGAARAWFGGPGNINKTGLTDVNKRLSIGDYGKSYMAGLEAGTDPTRVAAYAPTDTATDAPSPMARGGRMAIPPLTEENPVTPSDITPAPTRLAEARGAVPGVAPVLSPGAAPGGPPKAYVAEKPTPPALPERTPEQPREKYARDMYLRNQNDPYSAPMWKAIVDDAEAKRKFIDDRNKTIYDAQVQDWRTKETTYQQQKATEQERQQALDEKNRANLAIAAYGNLPDYVRTHLDTSKEKALAAVGAQEAINDAKLAVNSGALFGFGAEAKLQAYRAAAAAGNKDAERIVAATQSYKSNLGPIMQATIKTYAGKDVSKQELEFVQKMSGSDISLDPDTVMRILNIAERNAQENIRSHKGMLDSMLAGQQPSAHPALRSLYDVREPLPAVAVPSTVPAGPIVDVRSEEEANKLPAGSRFRLNGRTGTKVR